MHWSIFSERGNSEKRFSFTISAALRQRRFTRKWRWSAITTHVAGTSSCVSKSALHHKMRKDWALHPSVTLHQTLQYAWDLPTSMGGSNAQGHRQYAHPHHCQSHQPVRRSVWHHLCEQQQGWQRYSAVSMVWPSQRKSRRKRNTKRQNPAQQENKQSSRYRRYAMPYLKNTKAQASLGTPCSSTTLARVV